MTSGDWIYIAIGSALAAIALLAWALFADRVRTRGARGAVAPRATPF